MHDAQDLFSDTAHHQHSNLWCLWCIKIERHVFTQRLNMELHQEIKTLAAQLGAILTDKRLWITRAGVVTGGGVSYALTDTPGSSAYLTVHSLLTVIKQSRIYWGLQSKP